MKILLALLLSFSAFASDISVEMNSAKTKLGQIDNDVKTPYLIEFIRNSATPEQVEIRYKYNSQETYCIWDDLFNHRNDYPCFPRDYRNYVIKAKGKLRISFKNAAKLEEGQTETFQFKIELNDEMYGNMRRTYTSLKALDLKGGKKLKKSFFGNKYYVK